MYIYTYIHIYIYISICLYTSRVSYTYMMLIVLCIVSGQVHTALNQSPFGMSYVPKRLGCYNDQASAKLQDSLR